MSLIHTCELCGANPFDYLTEVERHAGLHPENIRAGRAIEEESTTLLVWASLWYGRQNLATRLRVQFDRWRSWS